jgi:hypothetical protein
MTQAFIHYDKKERRKGVPLTDASYGGEGMEGHSINQNGKEGGGSELHDLVYPSCIKSIGLKEGAHVLPIYSVKRF